MGYPLTLAKGSALEIYGHDSLNANATATITGVSASAGVVTYTANNNFSVGQTVTISGVVPSQFNLTEVTIASRSSTQFTVANTATGSFVSGGTARIISWNMVSEHNRSPITIASERIEKVDRMSNGTLRKFFIADKKAFSVSWTLLPSYRAETVDGKWGAEDLRQFYASTLGQGVFKIRFRFSKDGSTTATYEPDSNGYTVVFTDCSFTLNKRAVNAFWDVSVSFQEV